MSNDENYQLYDYDRRAREIMAELTKDGYPDDSQMTIVCGTLAILLAQGAESEEHLAEGIAMAKELLDNGSRMWFEQRRGEAS